MADPKVRIHNLDGTTTDAELMYLSSDYTVQICGGTASTLTPEAKDELQRFAEYLRTGGKKVHGSFDAYRATLRSPDPTLPDTPPTEEKPR